MTAEQFSTAKPSEVIRVALDDLKKVEADKDFIVKMSSWFDPNFKPNWVKDDGPKRPCAVCIAGSVMAKTLDTSLDMSHTPSDFPEPISDRLNAIDSFRLGLINLGLDEMGISDRVEESRHTVPYYEDDRDGFFAAQEEIIKILESINL